MDVVKFVGNLPIKIIKYLLIFLCSIGKGCLWIFERIFGKFKWQAPRWLGLTQRLTAQGYHYLISDKKRLKIIAATTVLSVGVIGYGIYYYHNRPIPVEPKKITVHARGPAITNFKKNGKPRPVLIYFSGSAAPIEMIGKPVTKGVTITPELEGSFSWVDEKTLQFDPKNEWEIGKKWTVTLNPKVLIAPHVLLASYTVDFSAPPLNIKVSNSEFYQDPQNAAVKQAIVEYTFSHPIDPTSFEKHLSLVLTKDIKKKTAKSTLQFDVTYSKRKLKAWVKSHAIELPLDPATVDVLVDKGVTSSLKGAPYNEVVTGQVAVPGLYGLTAAAVEIILADNEQYEPEQTLLVEMSDTVGRDINQSVSAWLLPLKNPEKSHSGAENWSTNLVTDVTLKHAQKINLGITETELDYQTLHSYRLNVEPNRYLYVKIEKGIQSFGGYQLGETVHKVIRVPKYPQMIKIGAKGALLSMKGDKRLSVVTRNIPGMIFEIGRVKPDQLHHLITMNQGSFAQPNLSNFGKDRISERFITKRPITIQDAKKIHYEEIDLSPYLMPEGAAQRKGVFFVHTRDYDPKSDYPRTFSTEEKIRVEQQRDALEQESNFYAADRYYNNDDSERYYDSETKDFRLVVVTDLGILAKKSIEGGRDVYIQSISEGTPVEHARVEVIGKNGDVLLSEITDDEGHVHFQSLVGFEQERLPAFYRVQKEGDLSFLPIVGQEHRLDYSRFDVGGVSNIRDQRELSAHLFSDRGLYRPGETFNIGMIIRADDWDTDLKGVPITTRIIDPRGKEVDKRVMRLSPSGFEELSWAISETSPTGKWRIEVYLGESVSGRLLGSTTVQVKEFQPDRTKVKVDLSRSAKVGWIKPGALAAEVDVQNLFGTPAQNRVVSAEMQLQPYWPSFEGYRDYLFYDPIRSQKSFTEELANSRSNLEGVATFNLDLSAYSQSSYQLSILAKAYEQDSGRYVVATTSTLISDRDYLIGRKVSGDLTYIQRDSKHPFQLIAVDSGLNKVNAAELTLKLIEKRYISILTKQASGVYKYQSQLRETERSSETIVIPETGFDASLVTDKPGHYVVKLFDALGTELSQFEYSVVGSANVTRSLERNAELKLSLGKGPYQPGKEIEVAIDAPYVGSGLITIERDKVYAQTWFKTTTTSSVQKIRLPEDFEGNGYINVQFIRDPSSDEIYMSPLSYGIVPFKASLDRRTAGLIIDMPKLVKPRDTLEMKVTTTKPERMVVFAIDEGILQVARYQLENPLEYFFRKRMLEVQTNQILDLILPDFMRLMSASAAGGDGMSEAMGNYLNPFARKKEKPVVYWSGLVDVYGDHTFSYEIPEYFNGQLRVMAVTVTDDKIGMFTKPITVRGDFIITPNIPDMVAPGDVFEVSGGLVNAVEGLKGEKLPIKLSLVTSEGLEVIESSTKTLTLGEKEEDYASFKVKARNHLGSASLTFSAVHDDKTVLRTVDLSVRPATPYRTQITMGTSKQTEVRLEGLRTMNNAYAKRSLKASLSPLVMIDGLAGYLENFPHMCTEQIISRTVPMLITKDRPELLNSVTNFGKTITFAQLFDYLHTRQNSQGGFGVWRATVESEPFITAYTVFFLLEAKARGEWIPEGMLNSANRYLQSYAANDQYASLEDLRTRAFATYLLTRQGIVTTNYLASIQSRLENRFEAVWKEDLASAWIAASYKLLQQEKMADQLMAAPLGLLNKSEKLNKSFRYYYNDFVRDATVFWLVHKHFPEEGKRLSANALESILQPLIKGEFNTLSSSMALFALSQYRLDDPALQKTDLLSFNQFIKADDKTGTLISQQNGIVVEGDFIKEAQALQIRNQSQSPFWYSMVQAGYDEAISKVAIKEGIEIIREYRDKSGKPVDVVEMGEEIEVVLKIRSTTESIDNIAIVDLLPGGFEPVQNPPPQGKNKTQVWLAPVGTNQSSWKPDFADIRDDRVIIYGTASSQLQEFIYQIRAISPGTFVIPPAFGEALYDRTIQAQAPGVGSLTIVRQGERKKVSDGSTP